MSAVLGLVDRLLLEAARRDSRLAVRWAGRIGRMAHRLRLFGLRPSRVGELLPGLDRIASRRVASEISAQALAVRCINRLVNADGLDAIEPITSTEGLENLHGIAGAGRGVILATFHMGTAYGFSCWLRRSGLDVRAFRSFEQSGHDAPWILETTRSPARRLAALMAAASHLKQGGTLCVFVDAGPADNRVEVSLLGRLAYYRRGAAALSRLTGAPIHPVFSWWDERSGLIRIDLGDAITTDDIDSSDPDAFDAAVLQRLASWLDERLRSSPELVAFHLEWLASPSVPESEPVEIESRSSP